MLNRAACHLQKGEPTECTADCAAALEILRAAPPPTAQPKDLAARPQQTVRALVRRMTALAMEGKYALALADAETASRSDDALLATVDRLRSTTKAAEAKERADKLAAALPAVALGGAGAAAGGAASSEVIDSVVAAYDAALTLEPQYAVARLNRSAALLKVGRYAEAAEDCRAILALLEAAPAPGNVVDADGTIVPVPPRGCPLHGQVATRAAARLAECERKMEAAQTGTSTG